MTKEEMAKFESGFNEGFLYAAQVVASEVLRSIDNHPSWMLPPHRTQAKAQIQLTTRFILEKRKLIPTSHQVLTGKAEPVELNFNLFD